MNEENKITFIQALDAMGACSEALSILEDERITSLEQAREFLLGASYNDRELMVPFLFAARYYVNPECPNGKGRECLMCDRARRYVGLKPYLTEGQWNAIELARDDDNYVQVLEHVPIEAVRKWDEDLRSGKWWSKGRKGAPAWRRYLKALEPSN